MSKKHLRKHLFVDRRVQGAIALRAARYWVLSLAVVGMLTATGWVYYSPGLAAIADSPEKLKSLLVGLVAALLVSGLLLPVVLYDLVRFTNRFAGPMVRLREAMQRAAAGESVEPIRFRDGDYWQEFADAFNAMQSRLDSETAPRQPDQGAETR